MHAHWKMPLGYNYKEKHMQTLQKTLIKSITKFIKVSQHNTTAKRKA
jgi:hypothetical protein